MIIYYCQINNIILRIKYIQRVSSLSYNVVVNDFLLNIVTAVLNYGLF